MSNNELTIRVVGKSDRLLFDSFLNVGHHTLQVLKGVDACIEGDRRASLHWQIASASANSPVQITIAPYMSEDFKGSEVLDAYWNGIEALERTADSIPRHFTKTSLEGLRSLVGVLNDGADDIVFTSPGRKPLSPTLMAAVHIDTIIKREFREFCDAGSLEGHLETISVHGHPRFWIWEVLTRQRIPCEFSEDLTEKAVSAFGFRVAVSGDIRYNTDGKPISIKAMDIYQFRDQSELPQFRDLERIAFEPFKKITVARQPVHGPKGA